MISLNDKYFVNLVYFWHNNYVVIGDWKIKPYISHNIAWLVVINFYNYLRYCQLDNNDFSEMETKTITKHLANVYIFLLQSYFILTITKKPNCLKHTYNEMWCPHIISNLILFLVS